MATLPPVHDSVVAMLDHTAAGFGGRTALVADGQAWTWREMRRCVAGFSRELAGAVAPGGRIATVLGNSAVAAMAPYAIAEAGAVHVPLNPLYTARELSFMLDDCLPAMVVADDALMPVVAPLCEGARRAVVPASGVAAKFDAWRHDDAPGPREAAAPSDAIALVQYTGGSTGRPKGVQLTHRAINTNIAQREALLPVPRGTQTVLCVMPLFHSYAMAMGLYLSGYAGATLVVLPRYHPERVLDAIEQHGITIFPGSPTIYTGLMGHARFARTDWSRVHTCYSGSSALPAETLQRWESATGSRVLEGYGQTEAGPVLTFNPASGPTKAGTVGVPVPVTDVEIVDVETGLRVMPRGELGEVRARGPQVMHGYLNREAETRESLRDGWLYTGDIGEIDADGYLVIRDRKKDLVIVGGYNVYPREVEEVLCSHPAVLEAAVVGQPDAYLGEKPRAYVVLRPGVPPATQDELLAHCRERLARYKLPAAVELVTELPKTAVNKIDKKPLRQRAAAAAETP